MNYLLKISTFQMLVGCLLFINSSDLQCQVLDPKGQAIGWVGGSKSDDWIFQTGGRFIPGLNLYIPIDEKIRIEGELSLNLAFSYTTPFEGDNFYGKLKPYRIWAKVSGEQFEIRAGLQKINFGSSFMLRPLMWFDSIDPRDPLQLTDGVYGLLFRYYFLNNTNIWLWSLYGNEGRKGWEFYKTDKNRPEFGGRLQLPVPRGEIAFTYHNRKINDSIELFPGMDYIEFHENRAAFDAKFDLGIGLWFEGSLIYRDKDIVVAYEKMVSVGTDYTFGLGNGLNITAEYFNYTMSEKLTSNYRSGRNFLAVSANYPLTLVAGVSAILYYDPQSDNLYKFINLSLSYDRFNYYIMAFWNPAQLDIYNYEQGPNIFGGKGLQVMVSYNY